MAFGEPLWGSAVIALLAAPALVSAVAAGAGRRWPGRITALGAGAAGLCLVLAVAVAIRQSRGGDVSIVVSANRDQLIAGVSVDRLAVLLLLLVFVVSTVVQSFAVRYLADDPRAGWFAGAASLLTAASAGLMIAATLITLALCWTVAGIALCLLLATFPALAGARDGVIRTATAFLLGDLALWAAVALVTVRWGNVDVRSVPLDRIHGPLIPVLACLVAVAALSRSAQIPFHRWLPATLLAPTPVSALLHAGVVNAGGILLVRLSPLVGPSGVARALVIGAGALTMIYGTVVMLVKPDVKGALTHSTMAQMGFMTLTCGMGFSAAAVFHLVAHGFYKATLFLSSGSAIAYHRRLASGPAAVALTARQKSLIAITAITLPLAALRTAVALVPLPAHGSEQALLTFAWATGAAATVGWLRRRPNLRGLLGAAAVLPAVALGYVALVGAVTGFLAPAVPAAPAAPAITWAVVGAVAVVLAGLAVLRWAPAAGRLTRLHRSLYAHALSAGHVAVPAVRPLQPLDLSSRIPPTPTGGHR